MELPITLWLSETDHAAVIVAAKRYDRTPEQQVAVWISDALGEARRQFTVTQWEVRRKALEADPVLAATVDAATEVS